MARITKRVFQSFQEQAVKAVIDEQTGEVPRTKGGIFTVDDIASIKDEKTRTEVQARYNAYVEAASTFNQARKDMSEAKWRLQNALNTPFFKLELITRPFYWNVLGLDKIQSIIYRDSDRNYREVYYRQLKQEGGKGSINFKRRGDDWDKAWDMSNEDTAELDKDTPQDTPDETNLPGELDSDPEAFLTAYRRKRSMVTKLAFYRERMTFTDEERVIFFGKLTKAEQTALYQQLNQQEKNAVYAIYTAQ